MCKLPEPETYALGMDEFVLGRVHRYLCEDVCYGGLDGLEDILKRLRLLVRAAGLVNGFRQWQTNSYYLNNYETKTTILNRLSYWKRKK